MKLLLTFALICFAAKASADEPHTDTVRTQVSPPAYRWGQKFAFQFESAAKGEPSPPHLRVFPGGTDVKGQNVTSHLDTLKFARGKSKLYPKEDSAPGLIVVIRSLGFSPDASGNGYTAVFEGEFNAIRIEVRKDEMEALLAGKPTALTFRSSTTKGFGIKYRVEASTRLQVRLEGNQLLVDEAHAACTLTYIPLVGKDSSFQSAEIRKIKDRGQAALYVGRPGSLNGLPILD
jgi:hypothetical protein